MTKEQHLVRTAFQLFYRYGVHATGINSILEASGIAKKTLYSYFKSKDDLTMATIRYRDEIFFSWLSQRMNCVSEGREAIHELFLALNDWFHDDVKEIAPFRGCYFNNVSAEYNDTDQPIHQLCADHKQRILKLITDHVQCSDIKPEDIEKTANIIVMLKEGAIIQASVLGDLSAAKKAQLFLENIGL